RIADPAPEGRDPDDVDADAAGRRDRAGVVDPADESRNEPEHRARADAADANAEICRRDGAAVGNSVGKERAVFRPDAGVHSRYGARVDDAAGEARDAIDEDADVAAGDRADIGDAARERLDREHEAARPRPDRPDLQVIAESRNRSRIGDTVRKGGDAVDEDADARSGAGDDAGVADAARES